MSQMDQLTFPKVTFEQLSQQVKQETILHSIDKGIPVRAPLQSLPSILITATVLSYFDYEDEVHLLLSKLSVSTRTYLAKHRP